MKPFQLKTFVIFAITAFTIACTEDNQLPSELYDIPVIGITKEQEISWEVKEPCTITFSFTDKYDVLTACIKYRGGMSARYDKHSFSFELDNKYTFLNLPHDDDWILNANYIDKTFMRHKLSYDLFREMDKMNVASQSCYVDVELNNEPLGLYVLMEEVNGGMAGLDKSDTLAMMFKDPPVFYKEKLPVVQDPANYYQQKYPDICNSDKTWYLEQFRDFLFNSSDKEFSAGVADWVDISNVTDWHLLLLLTNNSDGIMKNFCLYKLNRSTPFRFAIWDYDHSFGRDGDNELNMMVRELDCSRSVLLRRLMEIPMSDYPERLKKRWFELRESDIISVENIQKHIDRNNRLISESVKRNFEIWPVNSHWYYDDNSYEDEIQIIVEFVKLRIKQLDERFSGS
jgi:hypothetical protein